MQEDTPMSQQELIQHIIETPQRRNVLDVDQQRIVSFDARTTVGEALRKAAQAARHA